MCLHPRFTIDSIYHLDERQLADMGIKAVFSDLDNTLLAWNKKETAQEMSDLQKRLAQAGIRLVVISNNSAERVGKVLDPWGIDFIAAARKPLPTGILRGLKKYQLAKKQVIMVGDQLITDMQAANLAGCYSVLVKPLVDTDKWNTRINRFFERFIFAFFALTGRKVVFKEHLQ